MASSTKTAPMIGKSSHCCVSRATTAKAAPSANAPLVPSPTCAGDALYHAKAAHAPTSVKQNGASPGSCGAQRNVTTP